MVASSSPSTHFLLILILLSIIVCCVRVLATLVNFAWIPSDFFCVWCSVLWVRTGDALGKFDLWYQFQCSHFRSMNPRLLRPECTSSQGLLKHPRSTSSENLRLWLSQLLISWTAIGFCRSDSVMITNQLLCLNLQ